ncbi:uncharacterized protein LOC104452483 [Eucalyptus grandis]|uniref:uncharacterized protein LOC104452483 n=1 Tax=Eucalyptus grandis TaxID=71139 RepID=UPI00192E7FEB|nr:uncharacterized protein LOC104452483 [Eucalyptus grandis]
MTRDGQREEEKRKGSEPKGAPSGGGGGDGISSSLASRPLHRRKLRNDTSSSSDAAAQLGDRPRRRRGIEGGSGSGGSDAAEGGNLGAEKPARSGVEEEEVLLSGDGGDAGIALRSKEESESKLRARGGRQVMRRSSMVVKQVISIESALGLGFVSQLWVDTLSVGDVVLVENERVMENELKMVGLETLVGYEVVTPGRRSIGKV